MMKTWHKISAPLKSKKLLALLALSLLLPSCTTTEDLFGGSEDTILEGERISVLELEKSLEPDNLKESDSQIQIPRAWENEFWPQTGGYPNHAMQHLALPPNTLSKAWETRIGAGSNKEIPLTAPPVIVKNEAFTLDINGQLSAFSTEDGKKLWSMTLETEDEDEPVIGGGISFSYNTLFITTGYNEIFAVSPKTQEILWRRALPAASRSAPTVMDGRVFVMTLDSHLLALNAKDGSLLWDYLGLSETAGIIGAASPAANRDIVIPAFSSGEVTALRVENGSVAWSDNLSNVRHSGGLDSLTDIRALPIIDKDIVIAMSFSGRIVAINQRSGSRIWQRQIGGVQTPWVLGDTIFVLSNDNELVAIRRSNGAILWVSQMPKYENANNKGQKVFWQGPIFAGKRLFLTSTHGHLIEVDPFSGSITKDIKVKSKITLPPVVAGNALYILTDNGYLSAWK